jgi:hypothetical protein
MWQEEEEEEEDDDEKRVAKKPCAENIDTTITQTMVNATADSTNTKRMN